MAIYSLANIGGILAFLPLLTLLLPLRVEQIDQAGRIDLLTVCALGGAVAASLSNIVFGWLSDRTYARRQSRRRWIAAGLATTIASYAGLFAARDGVQIVAAVMAFQIALNMMLAPLFATMADEVPDAQKGLVGGMLSLATPVGSLVGGVLVQATALNDGGRFLTLCGLIGIAIAPLLLFPARSEGRGAQHGGGRVGRAGPADLALIWTARLMTQTAGNVLFTYLLFYFESIARLGDPLATAGRVGHITGLCFLLSVPVAVGVGRASDRLARRRPFLFGAAMFCFVGLVVMALAEPVTGKTGGSWIAAVVGYAGFAIGSATFLGLHSAYAMQSLPSPAHRGRDLGILNLANTLPAISGPALTWLLAGQGHFRSTLFVLAALVALGGAMILAVSPPRRAI